MQYLRVFGSLRQREFILGRIVDKQRIIEGIMKNPEGITLCLDGTIPDILNGFYVSFTNNTFRTVSENVIDSVINQITGMPKAEFIGSWYSDETREFFIDATAHVSELGKAMDIARRFDQQAVYDIGSQKAVYV